MIMSWKPEVIADSGGKWAGNALRFATREEAEWQVYDLSMRWLAVRDIRVVESEDPVTHRWVDGRSIPIKELEEGRKMADRIDGYDRDDLGESPDY
jgi:hypothetical protein